MEHVGGECHYSKLMELSYSDTSITSVELKILEYKNTDYFAASFAASEQISTIELSKIGDDLTDIPQLSATLRPPSADSILLAKCFRNGVRMYPLPIVLPIMSGVRTQLLYQYDAGLYVNYQIDRAYLVPARNILIMFTKGSLLTTGGDTMNGFMIFRILK